MVYNKNIDFTIVSVLQWCVRYAVFQSYRWRIKIELLYFYCKYNNINFLRNILECLK